MNDLIITHPGKAHFDEFLAISLILATHAETRFYIERRNPTIEELNDPAIWVVDIGGRHEPEKKNFDHHQDLDLGVSFVLVANYLGLTDCLKTLPWWSFKDHIDRFGPIKTAKKLGIDKLAPTHSPVEDWMVQFFAQSPLLTQHIMFLFGSSIIEKAKRLSERFQFWDRCDRVSVRNKNVLIGLTDDSAGLEEYCDAQNGGIDITITYDNRGRGWKLRTYNDSPGVNFFKLSDNSSISFAHRGGFVAKTRERLAIDEVLRLTAAAIDD